MSTAFSSLPPILQPREEDVQMMLSAGVHTGTRNSDSQMVDYIWRRRNDGVHIINIGKTWEKLMLAARVIVAIENPSDVIAISARPYGMRATLKYGEFYSDVHEFFVHSSAFIAPCEQFSHSAVPSAIIWKCSLLHWIGIHCWSIHPRYFHKSDH